VTTKLENKDRFVFAELHQTRPTSSLETGGEAIRLKKKKKEKIVTLCPIYACV